MTAKDFLKKKYQIDENKIYFDDDSIPITTTIEKICKYMTEYHRQQVKICTSKRELLIGFYIHLHTPSVMIEHNPSLPGEIVDEYLKTIN